MPYYDERHEVIEKRISETDAVEFVDRIEDILFCLWTNDRYKNYTDMNYFSWCKIVSMFISQRLTADIEEFYYLSDEEIIAKFIDYIS